MVSAETLLALSQQLKVVGFLPGISSGCEPGSYIISSINQNSFLHCEHIAVAIIL
jgi:hypothetical protein